MKVKKGHLLFLVEKFMGVLFFFGCPILWFEHLQIRENQGQKSGPVEAEDLMRREWADSIRARGIETSPQGRIYGSITL